MAGTDKEFSAISIAFKFWFKKCSMMNIIIPDMRQPLYDSFVKVKMSFFSFFFSLMIHYY